MLRNALKSMHEHSLGLPSLFAWSPRATALCRRAVLAHDGRSRPTWLRRYLVVVWLWLAAGHCAPTAVAAALPICCPTCYLTASVLLPFLSHAVAQPLPLLLASPRTWPCPCCWRRHLTIYGTAAAHVVLGRGHTHVPFACDGL